MTGRPATLPDLSRFAYCHLCTAAPGAPCFNLRTEEAGEVLDFPHPERILAVERDEAGVMVLGRREHVTSSRPGTTHGAYAHHAIIHGTAVCSGALIAEDTHALLPRLSNRERCQRPACKRIWRDAEDYR